MNMAEDQVDGGVESSSSFGEVAQRESDETPVLVADKLKPETTEESTETEDNSGTEGEAVEEVQETETEEGGEEEQEVDPIKGTKLDKNPESRAHQELANERKIRGQMEQVLKSPELMARFMKDQYGIEVPLKGAEAKVEGKTETQTEPEYKEYKAEDFENLDDVASTINGMQKGFIEKQKASDEKIEKLTGVITALVDGGKRHTVASNIEKGVGSLRNEKELSPNDPEFIPGLEEKIAERFNALDFDEKTGTYRGQHSIDAVGREILEAIRMGRKAGVQKGQTIVKDKSSGKVKTSPSVNDEVDTDKLPPGDSIALGISKMFKR